MNTDADSGIYLLGREDKEILDDYVKNEQRQRQNGRQQGSSIVESNIFMWRTFWIFSYSNSQVQLLPFKHLLYFFIISLSYVVIYGFNSPS